MVRAMEARPSELAVGMARALHEVSSVREVAWTRDRTHEHLWVEIASWSDPDFGAVADIEHAVDPDGTISLHIHAEGDMTIERTPVRPPAHARVL
jgi:hypothetical protein